MCAALANVEEDSWEWHPFDTVKGGDYLRRPARRRGDVPRGDRRRHRARALRPALQPHARGQDRPAPVRRPHPQPRRGAGPAGLLLGRPHRPHDPADAVPAVRGARRQLLQRVPGPRHRVRRRARGGGGRLRAGHRRPARVQHQGGAVRHRRLRQDVQGLLQRPHAHGRRAGPALPARHPHAGHGVLPVPPDRHLQARHPAVRGGARRGRHPAQRRQRALHGALRADGEGPARATWSAGRSRPRSSKAAASARTRTTSTSTSPTCRPSRSTPSCPTSPTSCAPTSASSPRPTHPHPAHRSLRHGRHPDQHRRRGGHRRRQHGVPRPLRRRRVRLRVGPRRQPARHQLAARHRGVRQAGRPGHGRVRHRRDHVPAGEGGRGRRRAASNG